MHPFQAQTTPSTKGRWPILLLIGGGVVLMLITARLFIGRQPARPPITTPQAAIVAVKLKYPALQGINQANGQSAPHNDIIATPARNGFQVTFQKVTDDCAGGCYHIHVWLFGVTQAGQVSLRAEYDHSTVGSPLITSPEAAIATVQQHYPEVREITPAVDRFGVHSNVRTVSTPQGYEITFWKGMGDCFAGCIYKHFWVFRVTRAGQITLQREYSTSGGGGS